MANFDQLKEAVSDVIKQNGNQEITGPVLQNTLNTIITAIGENAMFSGIATKTTNPGVPDATVFYISKEIGIYPNFGNLNVGESPGIITNKTGSWSFSGGLIAKGSITEDMISSGVLPPTLYIESHVEGFGMYVYNKQTGETENSDSFSIEIGKITTLQSRGETETREIKGFDLTFTQDNQVIVIDLSDTDLNAKIISDSSELSATMIPLANFYQGQITINIDGIVSGYNSGGGGGSDIPVPIPGSYLKDGSIEYDKLADGAVNTAKIANLAVDNDKLAPNSVTNSKIANFAVGANKIAEGAVGTPELSNSAVTESKIYDGSISTAKIADEAVTSEKLAIDAVTALNIAPDSIYPEAYQDNSIGANKYLNGSIGTSKIADSAITEQKLRSNSVGPTRLQDDAVTNSKLADGAVNASKVASDLVCMNAELFCDDWSIDGKVVKINAAKAMYYYPNGNRSNLIDVASGEWELLADGDGLYLDYSDPDVIPIPIVPKSPSMVDSGKYLPILIYQNSKVRWLMGKPLNNRTSIENPVYLASGTDLNDYNNRFKLGHYWTSISNIINKPEGVVSFYLEIYRTSNVYVNQELTAVKGTTGTTEGKFTRQFNGTSWSNWVKLTTELDPSTTIISSSNTDLNIDSIPISAPYGGKFFRLSSTTTGTFPAGVIPANGHTLSDLSWDGNAGYQLLNVYSSSSSSQGIYYRQKRSGTFGDWVKLANLSDPSLYIDSGSYSGNIDSIIISSAGTTFVRLQSDATGTFPAELATPTGSILQTCNWGPSQAFQVLFGYDNYVGTFYRQKASSGWRPWVRMANVNDITSIGVPDGSITNSKIADFAVGVNKIAEGAVGTPEISEGAVTEGKIQNDSVSSSKLSNNSVTTPKIVDGAITNGKLGALSVTAAKIAEGTILASKLASNSVTNSKIGALEVTGDKLANSTVTTNKIVDGAVTVDKLASDLVGKLYEINSEIPNADSCLKPGIYVGVLENIPTNITDFSGDVDINGTIVVEFDSQDGPGQTIYQRAMQIFSYRNTSNKVSKYIRTFTINISSGELISFGNWELV